MAFTEIIAVLILLYRMSVHIMILNFFFLNLVVKALFPLHMNMIYKPVFMNKGEKFESARLVSTLSKTDLHLQYPYWAHPSVFYGET